MLNPLVRVIDDDAEARSSISFFLGMMDWEICEYENALEFLEKDDFSRPGCMVLDVRMPGMTGLELQVELNKRGVALPIIFLSGHGDLDMAVHALKRGADDFLEKSAKPERLQAAVAKAVKASLEAAAAEAGVRKLRAVYEELTPREKAVALEISKGLLNKVIGANLGITERTVKMHRANVFDKMQVNSAVELTKLLQRIGVLHE